MLDLDPHSFETLDLNLRKVYVNPKPETTLPVMVDHVECLLELLYLVLVEHGEHIAGKSQHQLVKMSG